MMPHPAFEDRVLPLTALLISAAALFHAIRMVAMLGDLASALWFWAPQPLLFHTSIAGFSLTLVAVAAAGVSIITLVEFRMAPSFPFGLFAAAVVGLSGLFICYAAGSYQFRDPLALRALQELERHGYPMHFVGYDPMAIADALEGLGYSPPPRPGTIRSEIHFEGQR